MKRKVLSLLTIMASLSTALALDPYTYAYKTALSKNRPEAFSGSYKFKGADGKIHARPRQYAIWDMGGGNYKLIDLWDNNKEIGTIKERKLYYGGGIKLKELTTTDGKKYAKLTLSEWGKEQFKNNPDTFTQQLNTYLRQYGYQASYTMRNYRNLRTGGTIQRPALKIQPIPPS